MLVDYVELWSLFPIDRTKITQRLSWLLRLQWPEEGNSQSECHVIQWTTEGTSLKDIDWMVSYHTNDPKTFYWPSDIHSSISFIQEKQLMGLRLSFGFMFQWKQQRMVKTWFIPNNIGSCDSRYKVNTINIWTAVTLYSRYDPWKPMLSSCIDQQHSTWLTQSGTGYLGGRSVLWGVWR